MVDTIPFAGAGTIGSDLGKACTATCIGTTVSEHAVVPGRPYVQGPALSHPKTITVIVTTTTAMTTMMATAGSFSKSQCPRTAMCLCSFKAIHGPTIRWLRR